LVKRAMDASHKATMMRESDEMMDRMVREQEEDERKSKVQRQQEKHEAAFGNPWSAVFSVPEEKTKTQMTPRPPSSPPPRKSKATQTENKKEKEEEEEEHKEEHNEEERYNFVKRVDAMISVLKQKRANAYPNTHPTNRRKLVF